MSGIKYDFHMHSALSPCGDMDMTPNNIVNMAKLIGLDAIAVTDHNSIGNVRSAMKVGESVGLKVVPGMEVETNEEVHILTLYPDISAAEYVAEIVYQVESSVPAFLRRIQNFSRDPEDRGYGLRRSQRFG